MRQRTIRRQKLPTYDASFDMGITVHTATVTISSRSECQRTFRRLWHRVQRGSHLNLGSRKHYRVEVRILPSKELYWTLYRLEPPIAVNGGMAADLYEVQECLNRAIVYDKRLNGVLYDNAEPESSTGPHR
jgi:hypothetical protein